MRYSLILFLLVPACQPQVGNSYPPPAVKSATSSPISVTLFSSGGAPHELGVVGRGKRLETGLRVSNPSDHAVELGPIQSSCECLSVTLPSNQIPAHKSVEGTIAIDFEKDPNFQGALLLIATASSVKPDKRRAFELRLSVDVK